MRPEDGGRSPETGVTKGCEQTYGCWELPSHWAVMTFSHLYIVHFDHLHFPFSLSFLHFRSSETVKGRISGNPKVLILCSLWGCFSQSLAWGSESLSRSLLLLMRKIRHRLGVPSCGEQRTDRMPNGGLCEHPQTKPAYSCLIFTPFPIPRTRHLWVTPSSYRATWGYSRSPCKGGWELWNVLCMSSWSALPVWQWRNTWWHLKYARPWPQQSWVATSLSESAMRLPIAGEILSCLGQVGGGLCDRFWGPGKPPRSERPCDQWRQQKSYCPLESNLFFFPEQRAVFTEHEALSRKYHFFIVGA